MANIIDEHTTLDLGMMISSFFTLDNMTCGAFNGRIGRFMPLFPGDQGFFDEYGDGTRFMPKWQVAANLQKLCTTILDPLCAFYGSNLMVNYAYSRATHSNPQMDETLHEVGAAVDITIVGATENMGGEVETIEKMLKGRYRSCRLVFGKHSSWVHLSCDPIYNYENRGFKDKGLTSIDLYTNTLADGIAHLRGDVHESWHLPLTDKAEQAAVDKVLKLAQEDAIAQALELVKLAEQGLQVT